GRQRQSKCGGAVLRRGTALAAGSAGATPAARTSGAPMTYSLEDARALGRRGFKPWALATWHDPSDGNRRIELVSYPFPIDDGAALHIMARTTPGDPTTMRQIVCDEVFPDAQA